MAGFSKNSPLKFTGNGSKAFTNRENRHNKQGLFDLETKTTKGEEDDIQTRYTPFLVSTVFEKSINENVAVDINIDAKIGT